MGILLRKVAANRKRLILVESLLFLLKLALFFITYTYAMQVGPSWVWILTTVVASNFFIYNPISNFTWGYSQESKVVLKLRVEAFERLKEEHERLINIDNEKELMDCARRARASSTQFRSLGAVMQEIGAPTRARDDSIEMTTNVGA